MSELYDILVETPPTKVILLALDQGLWDCERSLNELAALDQRLRAGMCAQRLQHCAQFADLIRAEIGRAHV